MATHAVIEYPNASHLSINQINFPQGQEILTALNYSITITDIKRDFSGNKTISDQVCIIFDRPN